MSDRCSHGARVGCCDVCNEDYDRTARLAAEVAVHLRDLLPQMSASDSIELDWWRRVFSCRFRSGNLPPVGTALLGARLVLMEEGRNGDNGELTEWTRD